MKIILMLAFLIPTAVSAMVASAPAEVYSAALTQLSDSKRPSEVQVTLLEDVRDSKTGLVVLVKGTVIRAKSESVQVKYQPISQTKSAELQAP